MTTKIVQLIVSKALRSGFIGLLLLLVIASPGQSADFIQEEGFFRVSINGHSYRLEGMTVKRADATGRLPVALITPGKGSLQSMLDQHAIDYVGPAKDLANRGWLAVVVIRRGFGQSDGPEPSPVTCDSTSFVEHFSADADDLQATLDFIAQRPDADPTRAIAIGVSAGGAAVMALASHNPTNLRGVINISGGLRFESCPKEDELVQAFKEFGAKSRVPALWVYAKNDGLFGPDLVGRMRNAFLDAGGDVKLVMFDPIGKDGHLALFASGDGRLKWLQQMDAFLRFRKLPTWQRKDVDVLLKKLDAAEQKRGFVENFVAAPLEKALARVSADNSMFDGYGYKTIDEARNGAIAGCRKKNPQAQCVIVMENNDWIGSKQ